MSSAASEFLRARDGASIERLADALGSAGDPRAIAVLLSRLADSHVRDDPDVEDAVCGALVTLGVMEQRGNLTFVLCDLSTLAGGRRESVWDQLPLVPRRYRR